MTVKGMFCALYIYCVLDLFLHPSEVMLKKSLIKTTGTNLATKNTFTVFVNWLSNVL